MKRRAVAALVVTTSLALAGCAGGASGTTGSGDDTLTIALSSPPISLDPSKAATGLYINYVEPTYASLLDRDPDGKIVAGLADKWGYVGSDNTQFQLTLRDGLKWADGTPIKAADVVASIQYFAKGSGPSASYFAPLQITAPDDSTVVITSPTPNPVIPNLLTPEYLGGAIISPAGLKDPDKLAEQTFGAGPYVYDAAHSVSNDHYVFTPNKNYWDQKDIHYKSITIKVIPNMNSAVQALQSGQIDFMPGNADVASSVQGSSSLKVLHQPALWAGLFLLDRTGQVVPALADVRVRQALNYAVDRKAITKAVYGDYGQPVDQPSVPGFDGYSKDAEDTYSYDPAKAKQLLAEAGYANGLTIPVNYGSFDADNTKLVQAVQEQLADVGVQLQLQASPNFGGWVNDLVSKKYAATVLSPGAGGSEYFIAQSEFMPGGILNIFNAEDPDLTTAFSALAAAGDSDEVPAAQHVTDVATDHALALPVSAASTIVLYNTKLHGVQVIKGLGLPTFVTDWTSR
jgi:peptide/nickel transport system substrate-binding protein